MTRCTPKQYLIERRLELAKYLLTNGLQITEVVERTGFKNINSFKKLYAVHFGHEII
ncbi:MAG: helix-turn-helix domain-containing protein [Alteromonadaceae bacterium]|nr:helix-turn-helix domain-containing protein [Alteromonadaceae bacterium]